MNGVQAFQASFGGAHNWFNGTVADVTEEQATSVPAGVAHPIGELAAHVLHSEDGAISMVTGEPTIWEAEGYGQKLGIEFVFSQDHEVARALRTTPAQLSEYAQKVFARTDAYLASLTDADLDREVNAFGQMMPLGQFLGAVLLGNTYAHTGEISALKGLHSAKGYPF
ncbi:MAG: DinB family protein [Dehalococcoidia bacterium]